MKRLLLIAAALCSTQYLTAQNKTFDLYVVAEGNFGTPNGDVFKASHTDSVTTSNYGPFYQTANSTTGIDVLQDFDIFGNRAVLCGKGANVIKLAIAQYPSFDSVKTFTGIGGVQCLGKASNTKGYLSMATGNSMQMLDLTSNTLTPVSDPSSQISSYASYMVQANGYMYVSIGSKIVKIDTLTNTAATTSILPGIGAIAGMVKDDANDCIWLLGKVSGTSVLVKMEPSNNDLLQTPVVLTGITNAAQLRLAVNKLYFLSGKNVHAYSIASPNIPTLLYMSNLSGNSFAFAYGKSFAVDPLTGDFALASATDFNSPSIYEVVDGTTFQVIDTGSVAGKIANELILHTYVTPVPDSLPLSDVYAQCAVTLTPPTATAGTTTITGTTSDPLTYSQQGNYSVTWTFINGYDTTVQNQDVVILDTIAPVPDSTTLPDLQVSCPYTLTPATATDNCTGAIPGTTDSLHFTTGGTYTLHWTYSDGHGNTTMQMQHLTVSCPTGIDDIKNGNTFAAYPNPADKVLTIDLGNISLQRNTYSLVLRNVLGQQVLQQTLHAARTRIDLEQYVSGVYYISLELEGKPEGSVQKIIIK